MVKKLESKPKSKLIGRNLNREKKMHVELKKIRLDLEKEACKKHGISYFINRILMLKLHKNYWDIVPFQ